MISVVGSINMDMVVLAERIPTKGETVEGQNVKYIDGGKGANQAVAISRLNKEVCMFGKVGDDAYGKKLIENLSKNKINVQNIKIEDNTSSGLALITIGDNDNTIVVIKGANDKVDIKYIDSIKEELFKSEIVIMQHEIPVSTNEYIIKICKEKNIKTLLNPAPAKKISKYMIDNVDFITPNEHEMKLIFESDDTDALLKTYREKLIITLGSKGAAFCDKNGNIINIPCRKSQVIDTTGAGDTFNGAFAYAISENYDIEKALKFANIAAGLSTEKLGAQTGMPTLEEVKKEL